MTAADNLQGLELANGWKVVSRLPNHPRGTGGTFSSRYIVEKDGKQGFLKAFDFWQAFQSANPAAAIQILTAAYNHEKDILAHCGNKRMSNVVLAVDHGNVQVPNMGQMEGSVFYLIFEKADGDVRIQMDTSKRQDVQWCLNALHDVCLGLYQVHQDMIAHQDTKPSNVLTFNNGKFKVADFGRSSRRGHAVWYDERDVAGDKTYAPPELLYGYRNPEFVPRRMGCDLYMFGNLAAFLFSGVNVTGQLFANLDPQHHPLAWTAGNYSDVLPYLQQSFTLVLEQLSPQIDARAREFVMPLVRSLCNPDLSERGHRRGIGRHDQYSLERYVSELDLASKKLAIKIRNGQAV